MEGTNARRNNSYPKDRELTVALVSMPFASAWYPSIQLGLLSAIARNYGFPVETFHLNLEFAAYAGLNSYEALCEQRRRGMLVGEWLFSIEAFGDAAPDPDDHFLETFALDIENEFEPTQYDSRIDCERLRVMRHESVPGFLDAMERDIPWDRFEVVGFSSTFQQNAASIALARRIKRLHPEVIVLFGGANLEDEMGRELVRAVPVVDYAISGEADDAFPMLLEALADARDPAGIPGIIYRDGGRLHHRPSAPPFSKMDSLPIPDYAEYFSRARKLKLSSEGQGAESIHVPIESARGCWWGAKHHCTFCGLNQNTITYRSKSAERVREELGILASRHGSTRFVAVDNIMDPSYVTELFGRLKTERLGYQISYEIKSNMHRDQLSILKSGGIDHIQPGIESFSSHVLKLMRKGVTGIANVNLLRRARYYEFDTSWNLLYGFPNESIADYEQQSNLIPHLVHLQPPIACGRIWLERFSPLFTDRMSFPIHLVKPEASYSFVYPKYFDLENLAYFFDYECERKLPPATYNRMQDKVSAWRNAWDNDAPPSLTFHRLPDTIDVIDRRSPEKVLTYKFDGPLAALYGAFSERPMSIAALKERNGWPWPAQEIAETLDLFCDHGLMMRERELYLTLALPESEARQTGLPSK